MQTATKDVDQKVTQKAYTPITLLEIIRARLQPTKNTVKVKGIYEQRNSRRQKKLSRNLTMKGRG